MRWLACEIRCYAYLLRNLHRVRGAGRGGLLLRRVRSRGFDFITWRGKRGGWAGTTLAEGLARLENHRRMRRDLRHAFTHDPILCARYGR